MAPEPLGLAADRAREEVSAVDREAFLPALALQQVENANEGDDTVITCDAGENRLFMTHHYQTRAPGTLLMPGIGAMGYAVPAALAGKLIHPGRQLLAITGDGGFSMSLNGLMTVGMLCVRKLMN